MEARVAALAAHVEHIGHEIGDLKGNMTQVQGGLSHLQVDTAVLKERVSHLPSKGFIVTVVTIGAVVLGAWITFQETLRG